MATASESIVQAELHEARPDVDAGDAPEVRAVDILIADDEAGLVRNMNASPRNSSVWRSVIEKRFTSPISRLKFTLTTRRY